MKGAHVSSWKDTRRATSAEFCNRVFHHSSRTDNPFHPWKDFVTVWLPVKRNTSASVHFPGQTLHSSHLFPLISPLSLFHLIWNLKNSILFRKIWFLEIFLEIVFSSHERSTLDKHLENEKLNRASVANRSKQKRGRPIRARGFFFLSGEKGGMRRILGSRTGVSRFLKNMESIGRHVYDWK